MLEMPWPLDFAPFDGITRFRFKGSVLQLEHSQHNGSPASAENRRFPLDVNAQVQARRLGGVPPRWSISGAMKAVPLGCTRFGEDMKSRILILLSYLTTTLFLPLHAAFIPESVKRNLVQMQGDEVKPVSGAEVEKVDKVKLFALYFSAHWCPPCRKFTPELVNFYHKVKKENPEFEVIFVSSDRSQEAQDDYMKTASMPWPAVAFGKGQALKEMYSQQGIPRLVLVTSEGKILADSFQGEEYLGPRHVLEEIQKLLKPKSAPVAVAPAP